jgi:hypothetical protein
MGTVAHPLRNRVTPLGDIVAIGLRGAWLGNRGNLHQGQQIVRYTRNRAWITCALHVKDWSIPQWSPGRYTVLFFQDEAVSLAAGHRPCALCRRSAYHHFRTATVADSGEPLPSAVDLDRQLHGERLIKGTHQRRLHGMDWSALPDGVFVLRGNQPQLVLGGAAIPWTTDGYAKPLPRPGAGTAQVLTPPTSVRALAAGYPVQIGVCTTGPARPALPPPLRHNRTTPG